MLSVFVRDTRLFRNSILTFSSWAVSVLSVQILAFSRLFLTHRALIDINRFIYFHHRLHERDKSLCTGATPRAGSNKRTNTNSGIIKAYSKRRNIMCMRRTGGGGEGIRSGRKHMRETDGIRQVKRDRRPDQRMGSDGRGGCKYKESKLKGRKA